MNKKSILTFLKKAAIGISMGLAVVNTGAIHTPETFLRRMGYVKDTAFYSTINRTYVYASREEGEAALQKLSELSPYESRYHFLPQINLWINSTNKQTLSRYIKCETDYFKSSSGSDEFIGSTFENNRGLQVERHHLHNYLLLVNEATKDMKRDTVDCPQTNYGGPTENIRKYFTTILEARPSNQDLENSVGRQLFSFNHHLHGTTAYQVKSTENMFKDIQYQQTPNGFILKNNQLYVQFKKRKEN